MAVKKRIGIICGGDSSEREISLKSADTIMKNFPETYLINRVVFTKGEFHVELPNGEVALLDLNQMTFSDGEKKLEFDAVIVYIHGDPGENGKIQALFELKGIPSINSGILASSLSFDKWFCNQFLRNFGFNVADSVFLTASDQVLSGDLVDRLGLPLFVKPTDSGSSYGISKVKQIEDLPVALNQAFAEGKTVVVESFLAGKEVTCGVYRGKKGVKTLPLTEIASENEFFDFDAKYNGKSQEITPARVDDTTRLKVQAKAKAIYELLQLKSVARIDFMVVDREPFIIEVNTTPGFSPASIVPQMLACEGISIQDFWTEILEVELES